jgi:hypothetical protein
MLPDAIGRFALVFRESIPYEIRKILVRFGRNWNRRMGGEVGNFDAASPR